MSPTRPILFLFLLSSALLSAQEAGPAAGERVRALIEQLGDESFERRQEAHEALGAMGEQALPALLEGLEHPDPEVRERVEILIRSIPRRTMDFATRRPDARGLLLERHGGRGTALAVERALDWLAARQDGETGGWHAAPDGGAGWTDVGQSGLALLCFLGIGGTDPAGPHLPTVRRGLEYLREAQDAEGCFGSREGHFLYNHAIATLAMVEAYGMTEDPLLLGPARAGVEFLVAARNPGFAWRYGVRSGDNDTSVTSWAVRALATARGVGIGVPDDALTGARNWFVSVTDDQYYRTGYIQRGDMGARLVAQLGKFAPAETCTAISIASRLAMGDEARDPILRGQGDILSQNLPRWDVDGGPGGTSRIDFYYWFHGTEAMFQLGGDYWKTWNDCLKKALVGNQVTEGDEAGSWEPIGAWASESGRLATTALATLSLEVYYRSPRAGR